MNDPISDMLTRIRNSQMIGKDEVFVPFSNQKLRIAEILKSEGYLADVEKQEGPRGQKLRFLLKYKDGVGAITALERVSKPGRRIYMRCNDIPRVLQDMGIAIVSTSKGMMTGHQAKEKHLGGEVICKIW